MVVHINEAGRDYQPLRVDAADGPPACQLSHRRNPAVLDADIAVHCGVAGAVGDPAVVNEDIELLCGRDGGGHQGEDGNPDRDGHLVLRNHHGISGLAPDKSSPVLLIFST